jgi:amidohydrolase
MSIMNETEQDGMLQKIKTAARRILPEVIGFRHHLHRNPELSFQEEQTGKFIEGVLTRYNIPFTSGWVGYGIVGIISGKDGGPVVALRADMDALPIQEENLVEYKSVNDGVMHACGHDVHMASLLGAVIVLQELKDHIAGTVKIIFQPGEEKLPGGASVMIREGVLKNPEVGCIIAQHVFPSMEAGKVGYRSGLYMASADEIYIDVIGKGGHAAMPSDCVDSILAAGQVISALQQITARKAPPSIPTVLSFGKINSAGGATNVIPDRVKLEGTFRTMDENWRAEAHKLIIQIAENTAAGYGAACDVRIEKGYPVLINDPDFTESMSDSMKHYINPENVEIIPMRMTSEDFAFYGQHVPAFFYRLGTGNLQRGITAPVHTPVFDIDETALENGAGLMAYLAYCAIEDLKKSR